MFAAPTLKVQPNASVSPISKVLSQRSVLTARQFREYGHNEADKDQRTYINSSRPGVLSTFNENPVRNVARPHRIEPAGTTWDFSKIPVHQSDRPNRSLARFPQAVYPQAAMQTNLLVGRGDDPLEHEAECVAEQIMRIRSPVVSTENGPLQIRRKCTACQDEEEEMLQTKCQGAQEATASGIRSVVSDVVNSPGDMLEANARSFMESRFNRDFSKVRVHSDVRAAEAARAINALAYTVGNHVVFGTGQYEPGTLAGKRLLAHELTHTIQQQGGTASVAQGPRASGMPTETQLVQRQGPGPAASTKPSTAAHSKAPTLGGCRPVQDDLRPTAPWTDLQKGYKARCSAAASDVASQAEHATRDLWHGRMPSAPHLPDARSTVDCACATLPPKAAAMAAMPIVLAAGPLAAGLFWHFLDASGTPRTIDVAAMIAGSAGVRAKIRGSIARGGKSGTTRLEQSDYGDRELQFAYGAIDCVHWEVMPPAVRSWRSDPTTNLRISMLDYYEFHPGRPGVSQCAHAACVESVARGEAKNFWTSGSATVTWGELQHA
ncbi:DUF4157 domain-containing protein [Caballeronia sp. SEWSISQ10-4 2]|uniref:eCIS core domain-containing protein n=1 Tax=Caballeronia sp. SEWSISQ10-4 2 TaxID=2937438 RepID=UPI002650E263|nr:DUF4157 domain-containing protein [Caballeronia sp. SEWSISQ10-4 2]MDN7179980.1 DUF4157 domain-containing protein [Caballeronia sp. SEWSISQ10-4 2]